jgi:gamma-tubulin complex component 2
MYKLVQALSPVTVPEESESEDGDSASGESSEDEATKRRREALGLAPLPASLKNASPNNTKPATSSYAEFPIVGGEVLAVISSIMKLQSGDPDASRVYGLLWQKSSQPYMKMLKRWMTRGIWRDRWEEGCVREAKWTANVTSSGDEEWERRYTVRGVHVPGTELMNN